jgi:hypothetical protein
MAQPTPQTLRVFEMFGEDAGDEEQPILQYITNNQRLIDVNYEHPVQGTILLLCTRYGYSKVMKKYLDLGATLNEQTINAFIGDFSFDSPLARAKELMTALLNAGFPKEKMLHVVCSIMSGVHKELLKTLLEQPLDINYKHNGKTVLHVLIDEYAGSGNEFRGIFKEMLRTLMQKGANPDEVDAEGRTAIQLVNQLLNHLNPGLIRQILQTPTAVPAATIAPVAAPAAAAAPAVAAQDYKKLWAEELKKPSPDIAKLEEYKNAGAIDVNAMIDSRDNPLSLRLSIKPVFTVLEALLKWGANPNFFLLNERYPVYWKIFDRSIKDMKNILDLIIKYGADVKLITDAEAFTRVGRNPVFATNISVLMYFVNKHRYSSFTPEYERILNLLIKKGANVNYTNQKDGDVLDICLKEAIEKGVSYFLLKGMSMTIDNRTRFYFLLQRLTNLIKPTESDTTFRYVVNNSFHGVELMLKYDSKNLNNYFRDFLYFSLINPTSPILVHAYPKLMSILNPNYNEPYADGSTALIKAVQLYTKVPQEWVKSMIQTIVEKGADTKYTDPTGKKAVDYTTDEELKELLGSGGFKILWTGFSKGDLDFTNTVFNQVVHAESLSKEFNDEWLFSICPVCLKHVQHENKTCMYMTHSCVEQAEHKGYYHKKLWNAFSYKKQYYPNGEEIPAHLQKLVVEWCTHCGRICKNHTHYILSRIYKSNGSVHVPVFAGEGDYFATTCDKPGIGGGGIKEKIIRYRQFREMVYYLNDADEFINKITFEDAINRLVEAVWEAPLDPRRNIVSHIQKTGKYNRAVANALYPLPSELPKPPKYIYSVPTYPDAANPDLLPLVFDKATDAIKNSAANVFGYEENIVQFRHRMANGAVNKHDGPNQQVALDRLMGYIKLVSETPNSNDFGMCWQHKLDNYGVNDFLDDKEHKPPKCTARLYPEELLHILQKANYKLDQNSNSTSNDNMDIDAKNKHLQIYNDYVYLFGQKFGKPIGIAATNNSNNSNNKPNASNSKNNNSNQDGGKRWATRKCMRKRKTSKSKTYRNHFRS